MVKRFKVQDVENGGEGRGKNLLRIAAVVSAPRQFDGEV